MTGMEPSAYSDIYLQDLFDRMGATYDTVNLVSSFGFSELWRYECVANAHIRKGSTVCDMMAGSGECWRYLVNREASIISVDFSRVMTRRQNIRKKRCDSAVEVRCENALQTSISSQSIDHVVCAFGLKTLDDGGLKGFAKEIARILKPG